MTTENRDILTWYHTAPRIPQEPSNCVVLAEDENVMEPVALSGA